MSTLHKHTWVFCSASGDQYGNTYRIYRCSCGIMANVPQELVGGAA